MMVARSDNYLVIELDPLRVFGGVSFSVTYSWKTEIPSKIHLLVCFIKAYVKNPEKPRTRSATRRTHVTSWRPLRSLTPRNITNRVDKTDNRVTIKRPHVAEGGYGADSKWNRHRWYLVYANSTRWNRMMSICYCQIYIGMTEKCRRQRNFVFILIMKMDYTLDWF